MTRSEARREYMKRYYAEHREKMIATANKWEAEHPDKVSERGKRRRARLEAAGLCNRCGVRPASPGRKACEVCAAYSRELHRQARERKKARPSGCEEVKDGR